LAQYGSTIIKAKRATTDVAGRGSLPVPEGAEHKLVKRSPYARLERAISLLTVKMADANDGGGAVGVPMVLRGVRYWSVDARLGGMGAGSTYRGSARQICMGVMGREKGMV